MSDDRAKTPRTLLISDHIWEALSSMAAEMGSERDALVNQALYTFARLNGFLLPSDLQDLGVVPRTALTDSGRLRIAPSSGPTLIADKAAIPRAHANPERVPETAQLAAGGMPRRAPPPPAPAPATADDRLTEEAATTTDLPRIAAGPAPELVLLSDGRELERVAKDRFVIGRGKHCDLVISSGKVSREHAVIIRDGNDYYIEDLGSSNGTWFNKQRIKRRKVEDGDEYFICSEKVKLVFR